MATPAKLIISERLDPSGPVVVLAGDGDSASAGRLRLALLERLPAGVTRLVVDVAGLDFADSSTVAALATVARVLRQRHGALTLLNPNERVRLVLEMTGAATLMNLDGTPPAAPG
jgi:anti-sigma B factor antagonist